MPKFLAENYGTSKGARWKVPGNPGADGGLRYLGEEVQEYKKRFEITSSDNKSDWKALIALCRILNQTPTEQLEEALKPVLDIDGVLWFLALDNVLVNGDGYWTRASDYSLYRDPKGQFHVIPHDMNETFQPAMMFGPGPGFGLPPGSGGRPGAGPGGGRPGAGTGLGRGPGSGPPAGDLDPLVGSKDQRKPLRSRLLAVPSLKARYLSHVRMLAERWLDWETLAPIVERYRGLIEPVLEADTRKLSSLASFQKSISGDPPKESEPGRGRLEPSLRSFAEGRRRYLLNHAEVKKPGPEPASR
jgi:CotH kinase protein